MIELIKHNLDKAKETHTRLLQYSNEDAIYMANLDMVYWEQSLAHWNNIQPVTPSTCT